MSENPVETYRAALPGEVVESDLSAFDTTGSAVWSVALLGPPGGNGIGYGPDVETARTSAYGELVEWTRSHAVLSTAAARTATYTELLSSGEPVADPRTLCLPAGSSWAPGTRLEWLQTRRLRDGEAVWVPVDLLASRPVDRPGATPITTAITNGLGAGLDPDRALSHALLELLQRDGNGLVFRALDRGVVVDLDGLRDPVALSTLDRLRAAGVDPVVKLASTHLDMVDVYAVGLGSPVDGEAVTTSGCGEACHPDRDVAVRKALLELCSSRARKTFAHGRLDRVRRLAGADYLDRYLASLPADALEAEEPRALAAMAEWVQLTPEQLSERLSTTVLAERSRVALTDLPTTPDLDTPAQLAAHVVGALHDGGFDVLALDLSGRGACAVKAVVPGLEVETMSYGRIGERGVARARELDLPFVRVGGDPGGWSRVLLTPEAEDRLGGPAWLDRAGVDAAVGGLYPLYREPARHLAQLSLERARPFDATEAADATATTGATQAAGRAR